MNRFDLSVVIGVAAILLGGCAATTTPQTDAQFGEKVSILKAQQILNPDAPRNTSPIIGLEGKAAKGAMDNYRDSFRKPPTEGASMLTIGVGGGAPAGR